MNAVEIEEAISLLAAQDFDAESFPYAFLEAFGNKETTLKRLKSDKKDSTNASDLKGQGGVLQRNNIHILVCSEGDTAKALALLRETPSTTKAKAKFILTTDGNYFEAEDMATGESVACIYSDFPNHFGFFLSLAGISTVQQIRDSSFDIRATSRLNKLYVELLSKNSDWGTEERRHDMNHFMARLIFCFFAEDTDIFNGKNIFTDTISQMSESNASNTHEVISEIFRAMNTDFSDRSSKGVKKWADKFPYVNGGLFSGSTETPVFSKIARSYLLHVGSLDWTQINPDIFGSMIQAVTDDEERGDLGMHYTSVPNILKVLNPLFLDDLREQLEQAAENGRKLLNLRKRISNIRIFDPACGSGNFLVIAYKEMRQIEAQINSRRNEPDRQSDIALTNFRGIELRDFPAEVARLALIIAEYQCDLMYRGQKLALAEFLPLEAGNWITNGNALTLDWLAVCPPTGTSVKIIGDELSRVTLGQSEVDFDNEGGETYICGNPPYAGSKKQSKEQQAELESIFSSLVKGWKSLDYVSAWFVKASRYISNSNAEAAFVAADGICQGQQVSTLWPLVLSAGTKISFAHTSFWWGNLASKNAVVLVVIVGITNKKKSTSKLFSVNSNGQTLVKEVENLNGYLIAGDNSYVDAISGAPKDRATMQFGNHPYYGTSLIISNQESKEIIEQYPQIKSLVRQVYGSQELIKCSPRACFWIKDEYSDSVIDIPPVKKMTEQVYASRIKATKDKAAQKLSSTPWRFRDQVEAANYTIVVPRVSSCNREYLPCGIIPKGAVVTSEAFALYDAELWNLGLLSSRMHLLWIATVCGKFGPSFRYSNTIGWNTFPVPSLTQKNKNDLILTVTEILLIRESYFPSNLADLYEPENMPEDLKSAHDKNDEVLERIYVGRRFKNDTERLEKLFHLYTRMTSKSSSKKNIKVN